MRSLARSLPFVALSLSLLACATDPQAVPKRENVPPLPPVAETAVPGPDDGNAYGALVEGVLTRTRFTADADRRYTIEVRDLIVAPNRHAAEVQFPGAAILLVRQGRGTLHGIPEGDLSPGRTLSIPEGTRFSIENRTEKHIFLRAYVVRAR